MLTRLTRLTNAFVFSGVLNGDQCDGASSTVRTDLRPARINATATFAILRVHVLLLAVWTTDNIAFFLGFRAPIFRILRVHVYLVTRCNKVTYYRKIEKFYVCKQREKFGINEKSTILTFMLQRIIHVRTS